MTQLQKNNTMKKKITCNSCPYKQELIVATLMLERPTVEVEAQVFQSACINLLQSFGFHVRDKYDALQCIKDLCNSVNGIETFQAEGSSESN